LSPPTSSHSTYIDTSGAASDPVSAWRIWTS